MRNKTMTPLRSSITIPCKLNGKMSDLRSRLVNMPSIVPLNQSTNPVYMIDDEDSDARVCFRKESITIEYVFDDASINVRRRILIYFLSILGFLDELYEVKLNSLYPEIIDSLSNIKEFGITKNDLSKYEKRIETLNNINLKLYHRHLHATKSKINAIKSLEEYKRVCYEIMALISSNSNEVVEHIKSSIKMDDLFFKTFVSEYREWCKNAHE